MTKIFLSYRREDSAPYAGRVYDRLVAHFGADRVFIDIDRIEPGENFVESINRHVGASGVVLVLIGRGWADSKDAAGRRRLDDPNDFVRLEIDAAIAHGVRVIPVLVGEARLPAAPDLPEPLRPLLDRQTLEISDTRFHFDVGRLIDAIDRLAAGPSTAAPADAPANLPQGEGPTGAAPRPGRAGPMLWALGAAAAVAVLVSMATRQPAPDPAPRAPASAAAAAVPLARAPTSMDNKPVVTPSAPTAEAQEAARRLELATPPPPPEPPPPAALRVQDTFAPKSTYSEAVQATVARLNAPPPGRHRYVLVPSTGVSAQSDAIGALSRGTLDAASLIPATLAKKDEAFHLLEGPPFGPELAAYGRWRRSTRVQVVADRLYAAQGLKALSCAVVPGWDLWSRGPLASGQDLRGRKVRAVGVRARIYQAAGATVVQVPAGEVRQALAAGVIDAAEYFDIASAVQARIPEVAQHVYLAPVTRAVGIDLVVRRKLWAQFDDDTKKRFEEACMAAMTQSAGTQDRKVSATVAALRAGGTKVSALPAPLSTALQDAWRMVQHDLASNREATALLPGGDGRY